MINLRFRARARPLNPKVQRKAERVYHWRTTFSSPTINRYFRAGSSRDRDILWGLRPKDFCDFSWRIEENSSRENFSSFYFKNTNYKKKKKKKKIITKSPKERVSRSWILPELLFLCFFLLFNKRILLLILLTQNGSSEFFFAVEELYFSRTLYLMEKASQLTGLTFNNSPITRLVALKCGSARQLVISVTLNSVWQTTANVCALR